MNGEIAMTEFLSANNDPLNQASKKALLRAKADADPSQLYCLQLAMWGLETGLFEASWELKENLEGLLAQPPEQAYKFLLESEDPEDEGCHNPLGDAGPNPLPVMLAVEILETLHSRLTATADGYPPKQIWR